MNTGEGGLSPYHLEGRCDIVYLIGTTKYGVRTPEGELSDDKLRGIAEHKQVRVFDITMSQGAKPGKGGILPGAKVTAEIAKIRGIKEGQYSISPNGHEDIKNIGDLPNMISRARKVTGKPVGFKMVYGVGLIAHSCGVLQPRKLERRHVRIIKHGGHSVSLAEIHPVPVIKPEYINAVNI